MVADVGVLVGVEENYQREPNFNFIQKLYDALLAHQEQEMKENAEDHIPLYYLMSKTSIGVQTFIRQQIEDTANEDHDHIRETHLGRWAVDF